MSMIRGRIGLFAMLAAGQWVQAAGAQTPEQQQMWDAQRATALADEKARAERLTQEREARRADPLAWVRTLDPMTAGGWEFRAVATDGSWAAYITHHQMKLTGSVVTVWLRQEYAEPQAGSGASSGKFSSVVQKMQYDCAKNRARALLTVYYSGNDLQGSEQSEEADPKQAVWTAIVPGTRDELDFTWACGAAK
jgi:hypothetical protein